MRRGILTLTREELLELLKYYDINQKPDSQLSIKLKSANDNIKDINQIFVSSEELEDIVTLEMMRKYGRNNVRGGHWTTINTTGYFPNNNRINNTPIIYCVDI